MSEKHVSARKRGSEREHGEEKVSSTLKEGGFQVRGGGQAKRASLGEVGKSMSEGVDAKALQEDQESLGFTLGGWETKAQS